MVSHSSTANSTLVLLTLSFLSAQLVAVVSGPQYVYPTFGGSLNDRFEWAALESSFVSTACFIGVSFSGPLCSWLIENAGIKKTLRISAFLVLFGLVFVAETYSGRLPGSAFLCTLYLILTGFAGAAAYLCALDSQSYNFRTNRGLSMGLTTAAVGISGIVFSFINDTMFSASSSEGGTGRSDVDSNLQFNRNVYHYLYFLACTMSLCILFGSFILGPLTRNNSTAHAYHPIQTEQEISETMQDEINLLSINSKANTISHCDDRVLLLTPFTVDDSISKTKNNSSRNPVATLEIDSDIEKQLHIEQDNEECTIVAADVGDSEDGPRATIAFIKHPFGFSLFCILFTVLGMGYVYLANIGKIIHSSIAKASGAAGEESTLQEQQQHLLNLHIALFSLGNCGARAVFGAVSDLMTQKLKLHRLWIFVAAVILMLSTSVTLISQEVVSANVLKVCTLTISSAYGIVFGVAPAATTEFGGTEAFARNWGYLLFAPAFGSQVFNILFGYNFDLETAAQMLLTSSSSRVCEGTKCFKVTFQVGIMCGVIALVIVLRAIHRAGVYTGKQHSG